MRKHETRRGDLGGPAGPYVPSNGCGHPCEKSSRDRRLTGGGGAERQAVLLYEGLRMSRDVLLVALEDRNDYLPQARSDVVFLGKTTRF